MALLALLLTSVTATAVFQQKERDRKAGAGRMEASVLDTLRSAAHTALIDAMLDIQAGRPVSRPSVLHPGSTVSIAPTGHGTDLVWRPTPQQLADMGYLPGAWLDTRSTLNGAAYDIAWRRSPGCASTTCDIEGRVVLMGPIRDPGDPVGSSDAAVIGPLLTHFGIDAGVSLHGSSGVITGFGGPWTVPNPLPGQPPGVVAVRFGTASSLMSRFVRIGDTRDPSLAGEFSVQGQSRLNGGAQVRGELQMVNADGQACVRLRADGQVELACGGGLSATQARFGTEGASELTTVSGNEVKTSGRLSGNTVAADDSLSGQRLILPDVAEGAACGRTAPSATGSQYAGLQGGGLAFCANGRWLAVSRFRSAGAACAATEEGAQATDLSDRQGLICRNGRYWRTAALLSNFVLVRTVDVAISNAPVRVRKPICPEAGSDRTPMPLIILTPNSEDPPVESVAAGGGAASSTMRIAGINRFALDEGDEWSVHLERSSDQAALRGMIIASIYCYY